MRFPNVNNKHQLEEKAKGGQFWAWSFGAASFSILLLIDSTVSKNLEKSHPLQNNLILTIRANPGETQEKYPAGVYQLFKLVRP